MQVYKIRDDRDYIRPSRRTVSTAKIALADEKSTGYSSPVHHLQTALVEQLAGRGRQHPLANWHRSRLLVIGLLATLCWVPVAAAWIALV